MMSVPPGFSSYSDVCECVCVCVGGGGGGGGVGGCTN